MHQFLEELPNGNFIIAILKTYYVKIFVSLLLQSNAKIKYIYRYVDNVINAILQNWHTWGYKWKKASLNYIHFA